MRIKFFLSILTIATVLGFASPARAEGGIYASGGGTKTVGQTFTVTVTASGATFDSLQGIISVSGPVDVVSFGAGGATWLPGKTPSNGGQFVGIVSERDSITVATIKLKGKSVGSGSVSVSSVKLAHKGAITGSGAGGTNFTIERAPDYPEDVAVSSSTHPDQNTAYEGTTISLSWGKENGVSGFSYLLDQGEKTNPPSKVTSAETSISYANQAVGTYYFHIKAKNADGWGSATHFKITIKEPDAKIDESLAKPTGIIISKADQFSNDIENGTVTGIIVDGYTTPGFTANLTLNPAPTIPEGKTLSALANDQGKFQLAIDYPIKAGYYNLTVQGQKDKVLTPVSDPVRFEISQAKGGSIKVLTNDDRLTPVPPAPKPVKWYDKVGRNTLYVGGAGLVLLALSNTLTAYLLKRK